MTIPPTILVLFVAFLAVSAVGVLSALHRKGVTHWLGPYLVREVTRNSWFGSRRAPSTVDVLFCFVDHYEPISAGSNREIERERVADWLERYPRLAAKHRDSNGVPPQHSWFYPAEAYDAEYLDSIATLCRQGLGEIELHLHHGNDTVESLQRLISRGLEDFAKHGALLTKESPPKHRYAFIHGNMALANSRFDDGLCGVDDELRVLRETGCFADFSLPTAPCVSQPKQVNTIYYAASRDDSPKSHDQGAEVEVGGQPSGDLMLIPGPLGFNWRNRKWGIFPRIENGEIQSSAPPSRYRVRLWVNRAIHVAGRPEWRVVKVSCHGAEDRSRDCVLGTPAHEMYQTLEELYRDRPGYRLHYVTARELYNIVKAAEAGESGDPSRFRDFLIPRYQLAVDARRTT